MELVYLTLYLLLCGLNGFVGRQGYFGFFGYFITSLLLTPIFGFILILIFRPMRRAAKLAERKG